MWRYNGAKAVNIFKQNVQDVQIPVPWGHVAGRWWGDSSVQPVIGLHGLEDNANTFATLAPLLDIPSFLAIDMMGHGLSSHFPAVGPYHFLDFVVLLRRIADHFKWTKLSLIGHSFGSAVAYVYSALFPDDVEAYVSIDCARSMMIVQEEDLLERTRHCLDRALAVEKRLAFDPPSYTYEQLRDMVHIGSSKSPSLESCDILLQRGVKKLPLDDSRVFLSRDPKLRPSQCFTFTEDFIISCASRIKCRVLNIRASGGVIHVGKREDIYLHTLDLMQQCEYHVVDGNHHLHLNNPESVAPLINKFLNAPNSKL